MVLIISIYMNYIRNNYKILQFGQVIKIQNNLLMKIS